MYRKLERHEGHGVMDRFLAFISGRPFVKELSAKRPVLLPLNISSKPATALSGSPVISIIQPAIKFISG
jgi:hypothetical protein